MFQQIAPIFPTIDIQATGSFYKDKLDFEISYLDNYLLVSKANIRLLFYENKDKDHFRRFSCFVFVSNIQDLYATFSSMGMIDPGGKLKEKSGGFFEFAMADNNGHVLRFGEKQ